MRQLLKAVHYLHTLTPKPVAHRDLKPENVVVTALAPPASAATAAAAAGAAAVAGGGGAADNSHRPHGDADGLITVKLCDFGTSRFASASDRSMMQVRCEERIYHRASEDSSSLSASLLAQGGGDVCVCLCVQHTAHRCREKRILRSPNRLLLLLPWCVRCSSRGLRFLFVSR
jgi:serine/threonine protein kinase